MFAVFWLPNFRLQSVLRFAPEADSRALALIDPQEPKAGLLEVNAAARSHHVEPRLSPAQALARCSTLRLLSRSPPQEQSAQAALLEFASTFSPQIEDTAPGCATINLAFTRHPNWPETGACAIAGLAALNLCAQVGLAPNPDLALLAARQTEGVQIVEKPAAFLDTLPLAVLEPARQLQTLLRDWGIHALGQLTALPRRELLDRLGPAAVELWERAAGQTSRPLRVCMPAESFFESHEFELAIETTQPLFFLLRRFLEQLTHRLENVYRVAGELTLTLTLAEGDPHLRAFSIPAPTTQIDVLFRIVETHLDGLQLPHPISAVRLDAKPAAAQRRQHHLFNSHLRDPNAFGETLGRLAALVGAENVGVIETGTSHRPDSFRLVPPRFDELAEALPELIADFAIGLPLRRFRPVPTAEIELRRNAPAHLFCELARGHIIESVGPYRVSGTWWEQAAHWEHEEWDIALENGALYRVSQQNGRWLVEGFYAEPVR